MGKTKNKEELLVRKREKEKIRYQKIKNNPELYAEYQRKNKEKYEKRKRLKKVVPIAEMTERQRRMQRKKWRDDAKKRYERLKEKKAKEKAFITVNSPPQSDIESITNEEPCCSRSLRYQAPSPTTSQLSSPSSSGTVSPKAQRLIRKLRYKKDSEISSLRQQLQVVKKMNDALRKIHSRSALSQKVVLDPSPESPEPEPMLAKAILKSYHDLKSVKEKQVFSENLHGLKEPLLKANLKSQLRTVFRRRIKHAKYVSMQQKKTDVKKFLEDDENSSCAAGKKEYIKKDGRKVQKRYLTDSLFNLHKKFISAHTYKLSFATFCRFRPCWVLQSTKRPRETCLCTIHENFRLIVSALHKSKIISSANPTDVLNAICCGPYKTDCLFKTCNTCKNKSISYQEFDNSVDFVYWSWENKVVTFNNRGQDKTVRMVKKDKKVTKPTQAIEVFEYMLQKYLTHCGIIVTQQQAMKQIKDQLKPGEAVVHVDFSENYKCQYSREIQSAHFGASKPQITIHTSVLYYFDANECKHTQCFATLSPNLRHDTAAVWSHLEPILEHLKNHTPELKILHIFSDSAASQYRNFKIFFVMSALSWSLPSIKCVTWNYSEAGHGKGAPDGVGGVIKRSADTCVSRGIDVPDFETLVQVLKDGLATIAIKTIFDYQIFEKDVLLPKNLPRFKGTQQVHQIVWHYREPHIVVLRRLSCTHQTCLYTAKKCNHNKHLGFHIVEKHLNARVSAQRVQGIFERMDTSYEPNMHSPQHNSTPILDSIECQPHQDVIGTVVSLQRSYAFSAISELDLPSEFGSSVLDNILDESESNLNPVQNQALSVLPSDDDDEDLKIF